MFINNFDPVAFQIFSFEIRWYSLAYIIGILLGWVLSKKIFIKNIEINKKFDDYISYLIIGIIVGGRLGYIVFYNFNYYLNNILDISGLEVDNLEEIDSYDGPQLLDQYIDGKTITLEFDEVIGAGKLKKSLFKVKANGKRQRVVDAVALEDETVVELTLKNEVPPAFDTILVSYRDLKGDQRKGVIQDISGNDAEGFKNAELDFFG